MHPETDKPVTQQKVADDFDRYVETYHAQIGDAVSFSGLKPDFFLAAKCEYLLRIVRRELGNPRGQDALDLGCGIASYHPQLATAFRSLTGIDVSGRSIDYARERNPHVTYDVYPGQRLPYDDASFDIAFTVCVMHHVPVEDWPGFVSEMFRVLKPGGIAVVFEHNPLNPITWRIVSTCPIDEDAVLLPMKRTKALAREAGFADVGAHSILSIPPLTAPLYPVDEFLGHIGLGAQYYVLGKKPAAPRAVRSE